MKHLQKRVLCMILAATILLSIGCGSMIVGAATDACKIMDVSFDDVLVENTANTMNITVGSIDYSGGFTIAVYEGGRERQKLYEGSGMVSGYDWNADQYGRTVISVPIMEHSRGIVPYEICLTPDGGSTIRNRVVFRIYGADEVTKGFMISNHADSYTQIRTLLKQNGVQLTIAAAPSAAQMENAEFILIGTEELGSLASEARSALAGKSMLLFKNAGITDAVQSFLSDSGSAIRFMEDAIDADIKTQEYANCRNYPIIDPELDKDTQIKNLFFHVKDGSAVMAETDNCAEPVVMADSAHAVLMAELLPNGRKAVVAGSDFLSDSELDFSADGMYEQAFSQDSYVPSNMRLSSNYSMSVNLLQWLLPQPSYNDADIQTVKTSAATPGTFVSVTGTVVTPSEAIAQNGTAFENCIYLQDETGGIRIYGINQDVTYSYRTWRLNVKGYVASYGGEREIIVYDQSKDLSLVSSKDHAMEPQTVSASQLASDILLGNLVRMTGKVSAASSGNLSIYDDSGEAAVFVDQYIGSSLGSWGRGEYDPRIEYGCTVEVTGILSMQDGKKVIRIYDTADIALKLDQNGAEVAPPAVKSYRRFGGGLVELPKQTADITVTVGNEQKEMTQYMKLLVDLHIISAEALPNKDLPISAAFSKVMDGLKLVDRKHAYDTSVRGAALQILSSLGYDYFFTGNQKTANESMILQQSGLLNGIDADLQSALTTQDAARMVYNALEVPYFGSETYSPDGNSYTKLNTCILDHLNLTHATGLILETHYTDTNASLNENMVKMAFRTNKLTDDGKVTHVSGEDLFYSDIPAIYEYLGKQIEVFVLDNDDNDRNIVAVLEGTSNTVYRLPREDYVEFSGGAVKHVEESGKIRSLSVSSDAKLYVNGIYSGAVNAESMEKPYERENTLAYVYGWYQMIDNNNDGAVDCIFAEVYRDYIVGSMDKQTYRIDDKISDVPSSLFFDPNYDDDVHVTFVKSSGEAAAFSDVEKGDVLSVAQAKSDGRHVIWAKVVITKGSIKGKISAMNPSGMKLELNGKWYDYIELDDLRQDDFLFNLGDDGKFFINMQGIVIMKDLKSMPYTNYAFVVAFGVVDDSFDEIPAMCVYVPQGGWTSYYFAKNVTVRDGGFSETLKREVMADKYLRDADGGLTKNTRTLVNFELNDNGEIKTISFPFNNATGKNDKGRLTLDRKYNQPGGDNIPETTETFFYDGTLKCIGDAFLTDNTIIFDISLRDDETIQTVDNIQDHIAVIPVSSLRDGTAPAISLFDMGDGNECAAAVTVNATKQGSSSENLFIVNNTEQMLDENGDEVTAIYGFEKGEQRQMILDDDVNIVSFMSGAPEELGSGDLILYTQNAQGRVTDIRIVLNVAMAKNYLPDIYGDGSLMLPKVNFYSDTSNPRQTVRYYYGLVTEKYQNKPYGKLVLARDHTSYPSTLIDRLQFAPMVVTDDQTVFYRIDQSAWHPVSKSSFGEVISAPAGNFVKRVGDLAVIKTVNNIATDVFLISPEY